MTRIPGEEQGSGRRRPPPRRGWFSRSAPQLAATDQEAEVRSRLYAPPEPSERTVELVGRERRGERRAA